MRKNHLVRISLITIICSTSLSLFAQTDPLPSWNDGVNKKAIVAFVTKVTKEGSADFVPLTERIATFDNDGTLWAEQPVYFQFLFAMDQVKKWLHNTQNGKQPNRSNLFWPVI
jgi:hypothetical protein